jgi:hypothetical protein
LAKVVNCRSGDEDWDVYVGRPTKWGNPFKVGRDGTRDETIEMYRWWVANSSLYDDIGELRDKDLACWCAPKACHADVLLELANG